MTQTDADHHDQTIRFLLGDEIREVEVPDTNTTLLNYLRNHARRCGSKEGCAEGDCGACTVAVGQLQGETIQYQAVNACIRFLPTLDGCQLVTVEDLLAEDGRLHPVQQAMLDQHASQCGFCTPGIVMSLFVLYQQNVPLDERKILHALVGNLCRCTGYGPILAAAKQACAAPPLDHFVAGRDATIAKLKSIQRPRSQTLQIDGEAAQQMFFAPRSLAELAELSVQYPSARYLGGGTDVGLWVTKRLERLNTLIYLGKVAELKRMRVNGNILEIGAAVTYSEALPAIVRHIPQMTELVTRIGSTQIRNAGTIGGNIANGSPIGDMPPPLIVLGARVQLRLGESSRSLDLEDFYIAYGKQDLQAGEFIEKIIVPIPSDRDLFAVYKISKRFDQDISATCGAFRVQLSKQDGATVETVRICFGGMAGTPARAKQVENALQGKRWDEYSIEQALPAFETDFTPLSDMRASRAYRLTVSKNLLRRFYLQSQPGSQQVCIHHQESDRRV